MEKLKIKQKCFYKKSIVATKDLVSQKLVCKDLSPIVGDYDCQRCRHFDSLDAKGEYVYCKYCG